ncbi:MAG: 50S ribosomal protein L19, partial [Patescibacteria group bacterium]
MKSQSASFEVGDIVKVYQKIKEGDKERNQIFDGLVIAKKHGKGPSATFKVRKITSGVGVERTYPLHSPFISKIEVMKSSQVRRAKLYFVRTAKGKRSR